MICNDAPVVFVVVVAVAVAVAVAVVVVVVVVVVLHRKTYYTTSAFSLMFMQKNNCLNQAEC